MYTLSRVTKDMALEFFARSYGLEKNAILVIGDQIESDQSDLALLESSKLSVYVGKGDSMFYKSKKRNKYLLGADATNYLLKEVLDTR